MSFPPSNPNRGQLDTTQIFQRAFDEQSDRIRTDADVTIDAITGEVSVEIDAADGDNIAISNADGSKQVTVTTVGDKEALDVSLTTVLVTPSIQNVDLTTAGTEYTVVIPAETKVFSLKSRSGARLQMAFTSGESNVNYITIPIGCEYNVKDLQLTGALTVYIQSNKNAQIAEILSWI